MRLALTAAAALGGFALTGLAAAAPPVQPVQPIGGAPNPPTAGEPLSASLSTTRAKARRVKLTLKLRTELQCGDPGPAPLAVTLPGDAVVPKRLPLRAVSVNGKPARTVAVSAHTVTVTAALHRGILCDSIGPGTVTVRFGRGARIGNPAAPGTYPVSLRRGRVTYGTTIRISA